MSRTKLDENKSENHTDIAFVMLCFSHDLRPGERAPCIALTGGGTGGHVLPHIPVISLLRKNGWIINYIGSSTGIEQECVRPTGINFFTIPCPKFERGLKVPHPGKLLTACSGLFQATRLLRELAPDIVFSKGGFVAAPVALASILLKIPLVIHESDLTPGMSNRLAALFSRKICVSHDQTVDHFPCRFRHKIVCTGIPLREEIPLGNANHGRTLCGFHNDRPVILVIGGSLGAEKINRTVQAALPSIIECFQVVHLTGKGKRLLLEREYQGYKQFEFTYEIQHLFAMADLVVSRGGATTISEILALKKPNILLPLSNRSSRGEQVENAKYFSRNGVSYVIEDQYLSSESLIKAIFGTFAERGRYLKAMTRLACKEGTRNVCSVIDSVVRSSRF